MCSAQLERADPQELISRDFSHLIPNLYLRLKAHDYVPHIYICVYRYICSIGFVFKKILSIFVYLYTQFRSTLLTSRIIQVWPTFQLGICSAENRLRAFPTFRPIASLTVLPLAFLLKFISLIPDIVLFLCCDDAVQRVTFKVVRYFLPCWGVIMCLHKSHSVIGTYQMLVSSLSFAFLCTCNRRRDACFSHFWIACSMMDPWKAIFAPHERYFQMLLGMHLSSLFLMKWKRYTVQSKVLSFNW